MKRMFWKSLGLVLVLLLATPGAHATTALRNLVSGIAPSIRVQEDVESASEETKPAGDENEPANDENGVKSDEAAPPAAPAVKATFDRQSRDILESLKPLVADANRVTVKISTQGRPVALGVIVDGGGMVLTKASELKGNLMCRLPDGRSLSAKVHGIHQKTDLALLKIDAAQLPTADWSTADAPSVGYWVVTPKQEDPPALGIVSVKPRTISPPNGFVGVQLQPHPNGVRIDKVYAKSPAEKAGLQINDVIAEVNGQTVTDRAMLIQSIQQNPVGAEITLKILRDGQPLTFQIQLADQSVFGMGADRSDVQNEMGGRLSKRRLDFPMALQHDTPLSPSECGGPIVDLTGKIIGVNIARAGRVDTLALPVSTILSVIEPLKSGALAPEIVFKSDIERIKTRLSEIDVEMKQLPTHQEELNDNVTRDSARLEELKKVMDDVQARLKILEEQHAKSSGELKAASASASKLQKEKERLESDLQKFISGTN